MKNKWNKGTIRLNDVTERVPVPIIHDGVEAARGVGDGRMFPVVIIDASARPDIKDMIKAHKHSGLGDVETYWIKFPSRKDSIGLVLSITQPSRCIIMLEFNLERQGGLVDQIVQSQGLYLQCGRKGDRLITTRGEERILAEVPSKEFRNEWEKIFQQSLENRYRGEGLNRREARRASETLIQKWRGLLAFRMQSD